jgi:putative aldouronate transport system substrate-binding protein
VLKENPVNVVYPVFFGVTASMQTKWESLSKLESETMLKIITGEQPLEHFDEFVSTWKSAGGDAITQEVVESIGE